MPGEIVIRAPRPGDGPEMAQIWLEFAAYYVALDPMAFKLPREDGLAEWFEADIVREKSPRRREVVAQIDGSIAGFAAGFVRLPADDADFQLITDVAVARLDIDVVATGESFRRRGVARLLVRSLEEWAREQGAAVALATTYVASPISVPFWEQGVGYERRALRYIKRL